MYLAGVSVRRVEDITEALWGSKVSPSTISELNKKAYVHIEDWRNRPLQGGRYPYVYVDGLYLRRNWGGEFENVAILVAIAEGYAFAAKAGIDLQTTFEATRHGFAGGPLYDNKVPKVLKRDYEPGARIAVHRKDILNAIHYAHKMDVDLPLTDVVLRIMDWANDNGYVNEDQAALVRYYEDKMQVTVGQEEK